MEQHVELEALIDVTYYNDHFQCCCSQEVRVIGGHNRDEVFFPIRNVFEFGTVFILHFSLSHLGSLTFAAPLRIFKSRATGGMFIHSKS